ncbi:MAG: hypothetical protein HC822_26655 [Oscillochloris sp.]|nr:hypothetical protein [Oscillochloris sp.]
MAMFLSFLTIFVIIFEIWYVAAFLVAFFQLRARALLFPVGQGLALLAAFGYVALMGVTSQQLSPYLMLGLLLVAMVFSLLWRRGLAQTPEFFRSYPRGTIDVMSFRRPAADLKRRVRTK